MTLSPTVVALAALLAGLAIVVGLLLAVVAGLLRRLDELEARVGRLEVRERGRLVARMAVPSTPAGEAA